VLAEAGTGRYVVTLGRLAGLQPGDELEVVGEHVLKGKTGEVLYRERRPIGTLKVLDVSMDDRALAGGFAASAATSGRTPQPGDGVSRSRSLPAPAASTANGAPLDADAQTRVRLGDRFFEDGNYRQAIDEYSGAAAIAPSIEVLGKLGRAQLAGRMWLEGEQTAERLLGANRGFGVPVAHVHGFSQCAGDLIVEPGRVSYRPQKGEHAVTVDRSRIVGVELGGTANWHLSRLPSLVLRWRSPGGDTEKHTFVTALHSKVSPTGRRSWEGEELENVTKVHRVIERLLTKYALGAEWRGVN
jgi:hypothetical protein